LDLKKLRKAVKNRNIEWKSHALERMVERDISRAQVIKVLEKGEIIEEYPDDTPFPSILVLRFIDGKPLHVVLAFDLSTAFVVTVYEPKSELFGSNFRVRKKT